MRNLHRFEGTSRFGTWAYRIAVNAALDELRRRRRRGGPVDPALMREPPPSASQEAGVDDRLTIDAALARLSEEFRVAVVLRDLAGLDYAAIAEVLDIPIGTVRSRIARGRAALVPLLHGNSPIIQQRPSTSP